MNQCAFCGGSIPVGVIHCPSCGAEIDQSRLPLPVDILLLGRYRIERLWQTYRSVLLYTATDLVYNTPVYVREYYPMGSLRLDQTAAILPETTQGFLSESRLLAKLQQQSLPQVLEVFEANGTAYVVLEAAPGKTLQEILADRGPLAVTEALGYIRKTGGILESLSRVGIQRVEIDPSNLLVCQDGRVVLLDLGCCTKILNQTHELQSPSHASSSSADLPGSPPMPRGTLTDLAALAATLYTLLTGYPAKPKEGINNATAASGSFPSADLKKAVAQGLRSVFTASQHSLEEFMQLFELMSQASQTPSPISASEASGELGQPVFIPLAPGDITNLVEGGGHFLLGDGKYTIQGPVLTLTDLSLSGSGSLTHLEVKLTPDMPGVMCASGQKLTLKGLEIRVFGEGSTCFLISGPYVVEDVNLVGSGNQAAGLILDGHATGTITRCGFSKLGTGVSVMGRATGEIRDCTSKGNRYYGFFVGGKASPKLAGNRCLGNQLSGIIFCDAASGEATGNHCNGNGHHGIMVTGKAKPTLEGNLCNLNLQNGIHFCEQAGGLVKDNTCDENTGQGISVEGEATPKLEGNACKPHEE